MDAAPAQTFAREFAAVQNAIGRAIIGKAAEVGLVLTALFAQGHALLEDVPGTGKTSLARALAAAVAGSCSRIQFTPDLLPSDVLGANVYDLRRQVFEFRPGPVFHSILLADEINRASPKTQSALLQVMEEGQVTIDGETHQPPRPFMVIATQNHVEQLGTYPLPEAQLDRFLIRTALGYPTHAEAVSLVADSARTDRAGAVQPVLGAARVVELAQIAAQAYIAPQVLDYIVALAEATRPEREPRCQLGASTRGALALARCAKVAASAQARDYVVPDDVKALAPAVLAHRLVIAPEAEIDGATPAAVVADALRRVPVPTAGQPPSARAGE
ncbi:MAG: MoxR family ATPase [Bifidobacteriaceae bacterium]|jgi:MoxR-like ATPase|nr:MoxR family ATPase [Bifidobacteriaceae bacterium]